MPRGCVFLLLSLCGLASGCSLGLQSARVLGYRASETVDDFRERQRNREWAEQAWAQVVARNPLLANPVEYGEGFKTGFAEYLYHGGNGYLPQLPPQEYRSIEYQTPAGYQAINRWYAGYAHGSHTAEAGGFRRLVTGPPPPDYVRPPCPPAIMALPAAPPIPVPGP